MEELELKEDKKVKANKAVKEEKEETVEVTKSELAALMKRVSDLEASTTKKGSVSPRRVTEHTVRIREIDDKYVVGMEKDKYGRVIFKDLVNDKGNPDMVVGLHLLAPDGSIKVEKKFYLLDFLNNSMEVVCKVIGIRKEEVVRVHGTTTKKRVEDYRTVDTGVETDLEDISYKIFTTIQLPDGRAIEVEDEALNA